jgi:hypothetical protein
MTRFTPDFERRHFFRERIVAILALINLGLVFFDLSYLYARDFYLQTIPGLTQFYDPVKGIKPHSETENYLQQVKALESELAAVPLQSPQIESKLEQLRQFSPNILENNSFAATNKSGILEKIKEEIRQRTGKTSAQEALITFWSQDYLDNRDWQQELAFWNTQIRPLVQSNYYRDIDKFGFIDYFWLIDLPFVAVFAGDLVIRISSIKRRHSQYGSVKPKTK